MKKQIIYGGVAVATLAFGYFIYKKVIKKDSDSTETDETASESESASTEGIGFVDVDINDVHEQVKFVERPSTF